MRTIALLLCIANANACWLGTKENTLEKIKQHLAVDGTTQIDRPYIDGLCARMPAPVCWVVHKIGVENAFTDCDENKDGIITIAEMKNTNTCLTDCAKLAVLHMVL